jgi:hypothetical protein
VGPVCAEEANPEGPAAVWLFHKQVAIITSGQSLTKVLGSGRDGGYNSRPK